MFNIFKKKTAIGNFFNRFSTDQKKAIIASLSLIGVCDGDADDQNTELLYTEYFRKQLNVDAKNLTTDLHKKGIFNLIAPLANCSNAEKAALIFIFRGMANIDNEANEKEIEIIDSISKQLNFDLDKYYLNPDNEDDANKMNVFLKENIFPNGNADLDQGSDIINHFLIGKLSKEDAKQAFIHLAVTYELAKIRNLNNLRAEIKSLKLDMTSENIELLKKFLRGRILMRMNDAFDSK